MNVKTERVSFVEVAIPERRLSPIVVSDLLPYFSSPSADRHEPIIVASSKPDVFDRIPEILAKCRVGQKTPILVLPQQLNAAVRLVLVGGQCGLAEARRCGEQHNSHHYEDRIKMFCQLQFGLLAVEWISAM